MQITRVSPHEISAEPVAVRTKPGSIVDRPQLVRPRGRRCAGRALMPAPPDARDAEVDVLDLAQRHLQEAGAERAEALDVAGAEEAVVALAAASPALPSPRDAEHVLDLARDRGAPEVTIVDAAARACAGASARTSG